MTISDHCADAVQAGELVRRALGIAAGDDDFCLGVVAVNAANKRTRAAVGISGDAASIDDDNAGAGNICGRAQTIPAQTGGDGFAIGAAGTAPKILNMVFCHVI